MTLAEFKDLISSPNTLIPRIYTEYHNTCFDWKAFKEYNPKYHKVNSSVERPNKQIQVPDPSDPEGKRLMPHTVKKNRLPLPIQQLLVSRATAFTTGGKLTYKAKPDGEKEQKLYDKILEIFRENKMNWKNTEIVRAMYSETECAEIWYRKESEVAGVYEWRSRICKPSDGYDLIPVFDENGDLMAFGLGYKTKIAKEETQHLDIYTTTEIRRHKKTNGREWELVIVSEKLEATALAYGKIPVIYYNLNTTLWEIVQPLIERLEFLLSNFADTNDYSGSPILFASGDIDGWSSKGEAGKVIQGKNGATIEYITPDNATESIELEKKMLVEFIFTGCQTPNISFEAMKELGDVSGAALKRMMFDAHLKAKDLQDGKYGLGVQRRCNFLTSAIPKVESEYKGGERLEITPEFGYFQIDDELERIENAQKANGGLPVVDHKTSIQMAGLTDDADGTLDLINKQKQPDEIIDIVE